MLEQHPTPKRGREQAIEKAARLLADNRVRRMDEARVYEVLGDHETYLVVVDRLGMHCPCPCRVPLCSHVLAVAGLREREAAQRARDEHMVDEYERGQSDVWDRDRDKDLVF